MKNPVVGLLLGIFFGCLGADRFYKGDWILGIIKLVCFLLGWLTLSLVIGLFILIFVGIWWFVDLFLVFIGINASNARLSNS